MKRGRAGLKGKIGGGGGEEGHRERMKKSETMRYMYYSDIIRRV